MSMTKRNNKEKTKNEVIELIKFIGLIIGIYVIITLSFTYLPFLSSLNTFAIQTNSMEPVINVDDIVVVKKVKPEDVQVGDIMAFTVDITNDGIDDVVVHYIAEIYENEDIYTFRSKPEVSNSLDSWTLEERDLIGVYQFKMNGIGRIILFSQSWIGKAVILFDIILISILYDLIIGKDDKKITKQTKKSTTFKMLFKSDTKNKDTDLRSNKIKRVRQSMTLQQHKTKWLNKYRRKQGNQNVKNFKSKQKLRARKIYDSQKTLRNKRKKTPK